MDGWNVLLSLVLAIRAICLIITRVSRLPCRLLFAVTDFIFAEKWPVKCPLNKSEIEATNSDIL